MRAGENIWNCRILERWYVTRWFTNDFFFFFFAPRRSPTAWHLFKRWKKEEKRLCAKLNGRFAVYSIDVASVIVTERQKAFLIPFTHVRTRRHVALSTLSSNRLCPANWNFVCWRYFNIRRVEIFRKESNVLRQRTKELWSILSFFFFFFFFLTIVNAFRKEFFSFTSEKRISFNLRLYWVCSCIQYFLK